MFLAVERRARLARFVDLCYDPNPSQTEYYNHTFCFEVTEGDSHLEYLRLWCKSEEGSDGLPELWHLESR